MELISAYSIIHHSYHSFTLHCILHDDRVFGCYLYGKGARLGKSGVQIGKMFGRS